MPSYEAKADDRPLRLGLKRAGRRPPKQRDEPYAINSKNLSRDTPERRRHDAAVWTGTHVNTVEMDWVTRITDSSNLSQVQFLPASFEL